MQPEEKREIVEVITDKMIVEKDGITINLCYAPSCKDMANRWRKGWDSKPRNRASFLCADVRNEAVNKGDNARSNFLSRRRHRAK